MTTVRGSLALFILTLLVASGTVAAGVLPQPDFFASFDGSPTARRDGQSVEPTSARGLRFLEGVQGQAVYIGGYGQRPFEEAPLLTYPAADLFNSDSGTVMFWFQPDWEGGGAALGLREDMPWYHLFTAYAGSPIEGMNNDTVLKTQRLRLFMWHAMRLDLNLADDNKPLTLMKSVRNAMHREDWIHIAMTWHKDGWARLYVNGLPYQHGMLPGNYNAIGAQGRVAVQDVEAFVVGGTGPSHTRSMRAKGAFDDLAIYRQALTSRQVSAAYRQIAPLDLELPRTFIPARAAERIEVSVHPGGRLAVPATGIKVPAPVQGRVTFELLDASGRVITSRQVDELSVGEHGQTLALDTSPLDSGVYLLRCTWNQDGRHWQQSRRVVVFQQRQAPAPSDAPVQLGEPIVTVDCTRQGHGFIDSGNSKVVTDSPVGAYREAGPSDMDRFSYEINFPEHNGQPVILEITWPDDKPRSMALYMYRDSKNIKRREHRDRLGGGIQSGVEYPLTRAMRTTRRLFYPWVDRYLFEARTKAAGYPAAVAKIRVLPVVGRLPKLPINQPEAQSGRHFGNVDEDQSFEIMYNFEPAQRFEPDNAVDIIETLLDYFDYTGQDTLAYAFNRYAYTYTPLPGWYTGVGLRTVGWQRLMLDMFQQRDKRLVAIFNIRGLPTVRMQPQRWDEWAEEGWFIRDRNGKVKWVKQGGAIANPVHPAVRQLLKEQLLAVVDRYAGHPAFAGVDYWLLPGRTPLVFGSLEVGYGDFTIEQFEQENGLKLDDGDGPARFAKRYDQLTGELRDVWLAWRAKQVTTLFGELAGILHDHRPDLPLLVSTGDLEGSRSELLESMNADHLEPVSRMYDQFGIDIRALQKLTGTSVGPLRRPMFDRWLKHRTGGDEAVGNEVDWNIRQMSVYRNSEFTSAETFLHYFESFNNSLKPDVFRSYFQSADVKPHGRYFLQELGLNLASTDADQLLIGGQPIGTMGRDDVAREFARAYRALPAGPFEDAPGPQDPVVLRYRQTPDGVYVYALNLIHSPLETTLEFATPTAQAEHLSTGQMMPLREGGVSLALKPFELCSLRLPSGVIPRGRRVRVPARTRAWFADKLSTLQQQLRQLTDAGASMDERRQTVRQIDELIRQGAYQQAMRLIFSKRMRLLPGHVEVARKGYLREQSRMIAQGHYAVDCGASEFFETQEGKLFFPDRKYSPGGYGYTGPRRHVRRSTQGLKGVSTRHVFASESYNIDSYRFTVPNGTYEVKLHMRVGYRPSARPGKVVLNIDMEGQRVAEHYDLFKHMDNNWHRAALLEVKPVKVTDGVLDINYAVPPGSDVNPTARLANAIEIVPVKNR